ncbi:MAG: 6-pyruvoyl-tetrahydropterin synthase-related protein [Lachnospira sp.]
MKKYFGVIFWINIYIIAAIGICYCLFLSGNYPTGSDTFCHIYKGNVLYDQISKGNFYPLYDQYWYNGVQMMRYWAPLPVYFLAFCQLLAGGSDLYGYLVFVGLIVFLGGLSWLFIGVRKNRVMLGGFIGILWFFMPNNLYSLFYEGNLPRSLSMIFLPLFFYCVYEYLYENKWKYAVGMVPVFMLIILCHSGYAGMILIAMVIFLCVYRIISKEKGKCLKLLAGMIIPFLITGIWLYPSLKGGITSTDSSQVMKTFFQSGFVSLNPILRITRGVAEFYFGLAAFVLAVFGLICSKKESQTGFLTAIIIFACTTSTMYKIIVYLPGSQYLWMLRFISIALCMILYSLLVWKSLRKWILVLLAALLVIDAVPSVQLIYNGKGDVSAQEHINSESDNMLLTQAREITSQRASFIGIDSTGALGAYLLTDYNNGKVQQTFGAGWQSAATTTNIVSLNEAAEQGFYPFLFDRSLEMGDDTVLIKIDVLKNKWNDIDKVNEAAESVGYRLVESNNNYLLYNYDTFDTFGCVTSYSGIGIGSTAINLCYMDPDIEKGESDNINDYTFEELSKYKIIFLSDFEYDDKEKAEQLIIDLSEAGIKIVIFGDGIPQLKNDNRSEFLGVTCHPIVFENGYPFLYANGVQYDCMLFDKEYRNWKTVYFNGLDETAGYIYDNGMKLSFMGTVKNENITFIGLNLTYHYALTKDETAREIIYLAISDVLNPLPERNIVPLDIEYGMRSIAVISETDNTNTTLAYHDMFKSDEAIYEKNNLTYVDKGITRIYFKYAYLTEGIIISLLGIVLYVLYIVWLRNKSAKSEIKDTQPQQ